MYSYFFFSSRRRHTRYWRDWSSDVCSSDLNAAQSPTHRGFAELGLTSAIVVPVRTRSQLIGVLIMANTGDVELTDDDLRSEERRVGKECRSRWSPYH